MKTFTQLVADLHEAWPGTKEYEAKFGKPKGFSDTETSKRGNLHNIETKDGVTKATRRVDDTGAVTEPDKKVDVVDAPKRGRGRPPGKYGSYKKKLKESLEIIEQLETDDEILEFIDMLDEESYLDLEAFMDEDVEQIDELSKSTLGSYTKKAAHDAAANAYIAGGGTGQTDKSQNKKDYSKAVKRLRGVGSATNRLTK